MWLLMLLLVMLATGFVRAGEKCADKVKEAYTFNCMCQYGDHVSFAYDRKLNVLHCPACGHRVAAEPEVPPGCDYVEEPIAYAFRPPALSALTDYGQPQADMKAFHCDQNTLVMKVVPENQPSWIILTKAALDSPHRRWMRVDAMRFVMNGKPVWMPCAEATLPEIPTALKWIEDPPPGCDLSPYIRSTTRVAEVPQTVGLSFNSIVVILDRTMSTNAVSMTGSDGKLTIRLGPGHALNELYDSKEKQVTLISLTVESSATSQKVAASSTP